MEVQVTAPEGEEVTPIWKERGSFLPMGISGETQRKRINKKGKKGKKRKKRRKTCESRDHK